MLSYILRRFCQKVGLNTTDDRTLALDYINEAAREVYDEHDYIGSLEEIVVPITQDFCIALPPYVGALRAMREYTTMEPWKLSTMRPRYHNKSWNNDSYKNFRDKTVNSIATDLDNNAPPVIVVSYVEDPPIVVTLTGSTDNSNLVSESVTITALRTQCQTPFIDYTSITKDRISTYNVIIEDADENEISVIYNNSLKAEFRIVDVASYPFASSTITTLDTFLMECLYKKKLFPLYNDSDEFPVADFDDVIVGKACQLRYEDTGNTDKAVLADRKVSRTADRRSAQQIKSMDLRVDPQEDTYTTLFRGLRYRRTYK